MSTPRAAAAAMASGMGPDPFTAAMPAEETWIPARSRRSASSRRRNPSAMGERQMLPVQTTRMEAIERPESSSRASPEVLSTHGEHHVGR